MRVPFVIGGVILKQIHLNYSRVCEVKLLGNHQFELRQQKYRVSDALKTGEASALFGA
jgi:hypothetical protein